MKFRRRVPFIEQMEHSECGLACLVMILNYYNYSISLAELRDEIGSSTLGYSFYHLSIFAQQKNLKSKAYKADTAHLKMLKLPAIIHWKNNHFVVLEKIKRNNFYIVDPALGRRKIGLSEFKKNYSGYILCLEPNNNFQDKKPTKSKMLLSYIKNEKRLLFSIITITFILQIFAIIIPLLTKWIIDFIVEDIAIFSQYFVLIGIGIFIVFISFISFSIIRGWIISKFQTKLDFLIMEKFINTLFYLPIRFFDGRSSGDLLFRANSNTYIRQILSSTAVSVFIDILLLCTYTITMFYYSIPLSLYLISSSTLVLLILVFNTRKIKDLSYVNVTNQSEVQSVLSDSINGISDIKMLGLEKKTIRDWKKKYSQQLKSTEKLNIWYSIIQSLTNGIQIVIPIFILWIGSFYVSNNQITIGTLMAFSTISSSFINPIVSLSNSYAEFIGIRSYFQRIQDVIDSKTEDYEQGKHIKLKGKIEFKNVCFKYNLFSNEVIKNVSFTVNPGETLAIVGLSGSGKSTLAKLLLGLYRPTNGKILFDGHPIETLNISCLRQQIGAVMQDSKIFKKSIYENISLMRPNITKENVIKACKMANIYETIINLPLGFNTILSEKGSNLSGGQLQRILIARALVNNPTILVLDEATSAMDKFSEEIIDNNILKLSCTRIIITHRLNSIKNANKIIVLSDGEIVEYGNYNTLMEKKGLFYKMNLNQSKHTVSSV
jgi:ABC-type bacteriocin/lantibiotic exporter with double-glycine peptidase domain